MKFFTLNFINKTIRFLLLFLFLINAGASLYLPFFAIFITKYIIGASLVVIGISAAVSSIIKSLVQVPVAKRLDSIAGEKDDFIVILIGASLGVVYSFGFLFIHNLWELYGLQILVGIGDGCTMAAYYAIFSHHLDKSSEGFEWSLLSVGGLTLSTAIGGILGGLIVNYYGFESLFVSAGILNLIGLTLLILLRPYIKILRPKKLHVH